MQRTRVSIVWTPKLLACLLMALIAACNLPGRGLTPTPSSTNIHDSSQTQSTTQSPISNPTATSTPQSTLTPTPIPTTTAIPSDTPPPTNTPTNTETPTITQTPTPETATANAEQNVNCRWGPSTVYLHAGLFREGATASIEGRNYPSTWLWIRMEGFNYNCWVAASAVVVDGDLESVLSVPTGPPINPNVPVPSGVNATRNGNKVTISWNPAAPAVDLHYLVRAETCNGTYVLETVDTTTGTSYTIQDKPGCSGTSKAQVHVVNKTGYSSPVLVQWPP